MTTIDPDRLYRLLPAVYRLRDAAQGYPLRELIGVLAGQGQVLEADIARLYENWFIETCEEWVVSYLGDLLGVRGLLPPERAGWSQRALVANTLQYRQRKGTVPLLEQLVRDVTGTWQARAVELYTAVGVTQHLNHLRPGCGGVADLRSLRDSTVVASPFDPLCYTADLRLMSGTRQAPELDAERPAPSLGSRLAGVGKARPNLPNVGLYIWRLKTHRIDFADAFDHGNGRFSFSPLGNDMPLYHCPARRSTFTATARAYELPVALRNELLDAELAAYLQAAADRRTPAAGFLSPEPTIRIYAADSQRQKELPIGRFAFADLTGWEDINQLERTMQRLARQYPAREWLAVVDVQTGRIYVPPQSKLPDQLRVSYSYAFSDDLGGGPYFTAPTYLENAVVLDVADPGASVSEWIKGHRPPAVLQLANSRTFQVDDKVVKIDLQGASLVIQAADRCRPVVVGDLSITGNNGSAELVLSGLLIAGRITVGGTLGRLRIHDCTCLPGGTANDAGVFSAPGIAAISTEAAIGQIDIQRSLLGSIVLRGKVDQISIADSIVDADIASSGLPALDAAKAGAAASLERVTFFGRVNVAKTDLARNVLFTDPVKVKSGVAPMAVSNCYLPVGSDNFECQECIRGNAKLAPDFTSRQYGMPGYGQLSLACPAAIRAGGSDGAEIGVFHRLHQPQREGALLAQLDEYLRFGLEAGLIYVD